MGNRKRVQRLHQVDPAHPVNRGVVHLGHKGKAAGRIAGHIIEPLDHGEFPWWAAEIQRAGVNARRLDAELPPIAGFGQGNMAQVILKIEIRVLDPIGIIEVKRDAHKPLTHGLGQLHPAAEELEDVLEADKAAGGRLRVIDQQTADVHRRIRRFHRHK